MQQIAFTIFWLESIQFKLSKDITFNQSIIARRGFYDIGYKKQLFCIIVPTIQLQQAQEQ